MKKYVIETYVAEDGHSPFQEWLDGLKDKTVQTKLYARLGRASFGNFGDYKIIKGAKGLFEMREHSGGGYRILYSVIENRIVLLLAGSAKKDQKKAITKAKEYLADYERSKSHD
ncbi:MAG: type II toxin-antitoxin system RelE/ParE family toxin [Planctomycetes bacterium]|nr:type II toxin-antitoxin system RelE/ParE family toxin [Planctomycetota bacterium]